jgi:hypothetical protein
MRNSRLRSEAKSLPLEYFFSADYFTPRIKFISPFLLPFSGRSNLRMMEIGCYEGRSTVWFLENVLANSTATITCVDVWRSLKSELYFNHNIRISGAERKVIKKKGDSHRILVELQDEDFEIVYVDGNHRAAHVLFDAILSWRLLSKDGLLMFDDYLLNLDRSIADRPKLGIDLFLKFCDGEFDLLHKGYMVILRKRKKRNWNELVELTSLRKTLKFSG